MIHEVVDADSLEPYKLFVNDYNGSESEKRVTIDQALRDVLREISSEGRGCDVYRKFISLSVEAASNELCSTNVPFMLLTDIFDVVPLDQCEELFSLVEDKVSVWKSATFYDTGKNYLLRMCNDLLRRLSKSQNTVFCGRIQLFLSRLFPLAEKSALNLMSQFNLENITLYTQTKQDVPDTEAAPKKEESKNESMEVEDGEMDEKKPTVPIDYTLYRKFWSLQDFFRKPTQFYEKKTWSTFSANADAVFDAFASSKLDDHKSSKKKLDLRRNLDASAFFAKYLTSEKLLDLQLNDSNFRRYVLVQFLIVFQYLNAQVKFKTPSQILSEEQSGWVKTATERIYALIRETPPNGDQFAATIEHILAREEHWNTWKNNGCPDFEKKPSPEQAKPVRKTKRRRVGDDLQANGGKVIKMGNPELTKLWNLNPSNMAACKSDDRMFLPTLEDFFEEAIEQNDPAQQVEEEYKLINEQTFQWKALRLLARRSPQFFTNSTTPALELKVYLKGMLSKIAKEIPRESGEEVKTFDEEPEDEEGIKESQMEDDLKQTDNAVSGDKEPESIEMALTKPMFQKVAEQVGAGWKRLAMELNFPEEDIEYFASEGKGDVETGQKILTIWHENEGDKATRSALRLALKEVGFSDVADTILDPS